MLTIRTGTERDYERAIEISLDAFSNLKPLISEDSWQLMEEGIPKTVMDPDRGQLLVAEEAGSLVGSVRYTGPGHGGHVIYPDEYAYIRLLSVLSDQTGKGIGQALTEACIQAAKRDGAAAIGLHVARKNERAVALYQRLGFSFWKQGPDYFDLIYDVYVMSDFA